MTFEIRVRAIDETGVECFEEFKGASLSEIFSQYIEFLCLYRFGFQSDSLLVGVAARTVLSLSITMHIWSLYLYILTVLFFCLLFMS